MFDGGTIHSLQLDGYAPGRRLPNDLGQISIPGKMFRPTMRARIEKKHLLAGGSINR
jgi:hypothetical protein